MPHCSLEAVTLCRESHLKLLPLPPQFSHKLQPLDRRLLGHLKRFMLLKLSNCTQSPRACSSRVTPASFSETPLQKLLIREERKETFEVTGFYPINPDVFFVEVFLKSDFGNRSQGNWNDDPTSETDKELQISVSIGKKAA